MSGDSKYQEVEKLWESKPDSTLVDYQKLLKPGLVLDLGAGEGCNSLYLAQHGYEVEAVDGSQVALQRLDESARKLSLSVRTTRADIRTFDITPAKYSLIVANMVLHFFNVTDSTRIISRCRAGMRGRLV